MKLETNKEKGTKLEDLVVAYFSEIYPNVRRTKASGAKNEKGDIATGSLRFKVECKQRNTENCIINRKVWNKLCGELNTYHNDTPLLVLGNKYDEIFCVLDIKDLIRILKEKY
jgi:Holliday junction resolvase